jgi:hypothetical protein
MDRLTSANSDFSAHFRAFKTGDLLTVQDSSNAANWVKYSLTAPPADQTGWWIVAVSNLGAGGVLPNNNSPCDFLFTQQAPPAPDPWAQALPSSYTAGSAGALLGALTIPGIATGVWSDTTSGDFAATGSPGKVLVGQLGGAFTTATSSIYTTAALANIPSPVLNLNQVLGAPRALDTVNDAGLTVNDALICAIASASGKESITGTNYIVQTPYTATTIRTFILNNPSSPTSRS